MIRLVHGIHGLLLSFPIALFSAALAADIAYLNTAEIQWTNFASWLIAGALVFGGAVALLALIIWIASLRSRPGPLSLVYLLIVVVMWIVGLLNALQHSRDAWSSVGTAGLLMSIVTTVLALLAGAILFSRPARREIVR